MFSTSSTDITAMCSYRTAYRELTHPQNLDALSNLRIISIQSNRLTSITGVSSLPNLEELYLSHNAITDLSGLESNTTLRVLDFSNNQVSHLEHLGALKDLEELWASNNQLASFDEVERELKDKEKLETVYFEGNPLQMNGPALYRNKVRLALPNIKQIDASEYILFFFRIRSLVMARANSLLLLQRMYEFEMFLGLWLCNQMAQGIKGLCL